MKRLNKQTGITVRLSRSERSRLREAAQRQTRVTLRRVTPSELLREGGLARAAEILAAVDVVESKIPSAALAQSAA